MSDVHLPGYQPTTDGNAKQVRQAAKALAAARRPVIYAGGGVVAADASRELAELATAGRFPVTCTLMGLARSRRRTSSGSGCSGCTARARRTTRWTRPTSSSRSARASTTASRASSREFAPRAKFIHIDVDPAEISKNVPAHIPIVGDAKNILAKLLVEYRALEADGARLDEWWQRIRAWQERHPLRYEDSTDSEIRPQRMVQALYEATDGDAIVTSDVGQHQMWAAQYFHFDRAAPVDQLRRPRHDGLRPPGGDGREGRLPRPDGRLHRRRRLGPDEHAGAGDVRPGGHRHQGVHHEQRLPGHGPPVAGAVLGPRYSHVDMGSYPDFVKLADAYGATGMRFTDKSTLVEDMREALATDGPVLVDVRVTQEENVYPMIPAGQAARDMVG